MMQLSFKKYCFHLVTLKRFRTQRTSIYDGTETKRKAFGKRHRLNSSYDIQRAKRTYKLNFKCSSFFVFLTILLFILRYEKVFCSFVVFFVIKPIVTNPRIRSVIYFKNKVVCNLGIAIVLSISNVQNRQPS